MGGHDFKGPRLPVGTTAASNRSTTGSGRGASTETTGTVCSRPARSPATSHTNTTTDTVFGAGLPHARRIRRGVQYRLVQQIPRSIGAPTQSGSCTDQSKGLALNEVHDLRVLKTPLVDPDLDRSSPGSMSRPGMHVLSGEAYRHGLRRQSPLKAPDPLPPANCGGVNHDPTTDDRRLDIIPRLHRIPPQPQRSWPTSTQPAASRCRAHLIAGGAENQATK
jgi:hypothetical protein